jgi:hypothetical protein
MHIPENAVDPRNFEANLALDLEIADLINSKKGNACVEDGGAAAGTLTTSQPTRSGHRDRPLHQPSEPQRLTPRSHGERGLRCRSAAASLTGHIAPRHLRQELRIPFPPPDQHERVPKRARAAVSRAASATTDEGAAQDPRGDRGMEVDDMRDFEAQGGPGLHTGHASVVELQRVPVPRGAARGCCRPQSHRRNDCPLRMRLTTPRALTHYTATSVSGGDGGGRASGTVCKATGVDQERHAT